MHNSYIAKDKKNKEKAQKRTHKKLFASNCKLSNLTHLVTTASLWMKCYDMCFESLLPEDICSETCLSCFKRKPKTFFHWWLFNCEFYRPFHRILLCIFYFCIYFCCFVVIRSPACVVSIVCVLGTLDDLPETVVCCSTTVSLHASLT